EVQLNNCEAFEKLASKNGVSYVAIGKTGGDKVIINDIFKELDNLSKVYFNRFKEVIEQDQ
ncbi:MAG TPA: hypothetical protein PKY07_04950, partial [Aliarcobacter cryaerophilus]|nr:hypothetical protein [Aliarcobacter cryaerophilus]